MASSPEVPKRNGEALALARALVALLLGSCDADVTVRSRDGPEQASLVVRGAGAAPAPDDTPLPNPSPGCRADLLRVLKAAGRRLTLEGIQDAFQAEGVEWSDRTVKRYLKQLFDEGEIDNRQDCRPPGYGIPGGANQSAKPGATECQSEGH